MAGPDPAITATVRDARCKDCVRERQFGWNDPDAPVVETQEHFEYNEAWAQQSLNRGGSRTDRCPRHRRLHKQEISGLAVAYIDLQTIGEVTDRQSPMGPLGGLGPLPDLHVPRQKLAATPFSKFGMTDDQVREIYGRMSDPEKRVLVLKAGTGTGKSTFFPFRLLCPPERVDFSFTARGPIVVTEPRVQATIGVARYVGERLVMGCPLMECSVHGSFNPKSHLDDPQAPAGETCPDLDHCGREHVGDHPGEKSHECCVTDCARHIGPGYPVGYQVKGDARHDPATQLVYVTDGTMINWLREGRLNKIGTVVVDEAHERSTNIDFIMGYLRRELDRYPHLRVVITSATFDVDFYENYFGGPERVQTKTIDALKTFGYGSPLFPITDGVIECGCERNEHGELPHELTGDFGTWRQFPGHWPETERYGPQPDDGSPPEDLWAITEQLHDLRFAKPLPDNQWTLKISAQAKKRIGRDLAEHVIKLVQALEKRDIYGDVLAFLPNNKLITDAVAKIEQGVDLDRADVYALIQSAPPGQKEAALESRPRGSKRKIVVSTNLAETSLTVSGVRFVVDCALTTQGAWDPTLASKSVPTTLHSQAGVRQRWGRVGRDAPGWVFPLYTRSQFNELPRDTPAGSTRENLEQLVMKAKATGIDDVANFLWPAAHKFGNPDPSALGAMAIFNQELTRANEALKTNGVVDTDGHLTAFGKELERFGQHSAGFAVATIIADQLACVPEVVTALNLLEAQKPQGYEDVDLSKLALSDRKWPDEWTELASHRWQQLHIGCRDDLDVALRIVGLWERADPDRRPWEPSAAREAWARSWWLRHDLLLKLAELRRTDLEGLSAAMKEDVKRFVEPRLTPRARAAITRAFVGMWYRRGERNTYSSLGQPGDPPAHLSSICRLKSPPLDAIALTRGTNLLSGRPEVRNLVAVTPWAARPDLDAMDLMLLCAEHCHPGQLRAEDHDTSLQVILDYPIGAHIELSLDGDPPVPAQATVYAPFGAPVLEREDDDEESDGPEELETDGETSGAGSVGWPAGFVKPIEDEERNERLRLEEPDDDDHDEASGRPLGIETNDEDISPDSRVVDLLAGIASEEAVDLRVGKVAVRDAGWYDCQAYEAVAGGLAVILEPLPPERIQVMDPSSNPTYALFKPGMLVKGVVDAMSDKGLRVRFRDRVTGSCTKVRLPRDDYTAGEPVVARVHEVDADKKRLILDLKAGVSYEVRATAPEHWRPALRFRAPELNRLLDARVWATGLDLTVSTPEPGAAADVAERLRVLLGSPAAAVEVPSDKRGRVQGTRGANLIAARTASGALVCDFEEASHTLFVAAETQEQLRACLQAVFAPIQGFTARLLVPAGRTGLLIGKGGATVNQLKEASGCHRAVAGPDGHFTLAATLADSLERFAQLANSKVPGCALADVAGHEPPVRDLFGGQGSVMWRTHDFARADDAVALTIHTPIIVDMSPPEELPKPSKTTSATIGHSPVIRLAKVSAHGVSIIELQERGLSFEEYEPSTPQDRWTGQLAILDDDSIQITVGDYVLHAHRAEPETFRGIETGPDGHCAFDVVYLSGDSDALFWSDTSDWLALRPGSDDNETGGLIHTARLTVSSTNDWSTANGLLDAQSWQAKVRRPPGRSDQAGDKLLLVVSATAADDDTGPAILLDRDLDHCCYRSDDLLLYPIAAGEDLVAALRNGGRKRRRRRSRRRNADASGTERGGEVEEALTPQPAGSQPLTDVRGAAVGMASAAVEQHHEEVWRVTERQRIEHRWHSDGSWSDWYNFEFERPALDVAAVSGWPDHIEVYVLDTTGRVWHRWWWKNSLWDPAFHDLGQPFGGDAPRGISATSAHPGHMDVFVEAADGRVANLWYVDGGGGWNHCEDEWALTDGWWPFSP